MEKKEEIKFIRYNEAVKRYSISQRKLYDLAKEARAIYKVGKVVLINCEIFERYLETFRE